MGCSGSWLVSLHRCGLQSEKVVIGRQPDTELVIVMRGVLTVCVVLAGCLPGC